MPCIWFVTLSLACVCCCSPQIKYKAVYMNLVGSTAHCPFDDLESISQAFSFELHKSTSQTAKYF